MSEAEIPIDIAVRKLLDWLVSRRIVNRNWHEGVTSIRCEGATVGGERRVDREC